ncbi:MAG: response regulator [Actinomycetes bacterium]
MNTGKKRILVIDDNADIRNLIQFIFEKAGISVSQGSDGENGLAQLKSEKPDLVLLDSMMPGISGLDVLKTIREDSDPNLNQVPVVMLTANSATEDMKTAFELGASSYIVKPFKNNQIVAEIDSILQLKVS